MAGEGEDAAVCETCGRLKTGKNVLMCIPCYGKAWRKRNKARAKKWRDDHRKELNAYQRDYYRKNLSSTARGL